MRNRNNYSVRHVLKILTLQSWLVDLDGASCSCVLISHFIISCYKSEITISRNQIFVQNNPSLKFIKVHQRPD